MTRDLTKSWTIKQTACLVFLFFFSLNVFASFQQIILVRHAERGQGDYLTENGHARAMKLAVMLKDEKIQTIFSTPYVRTESTVMPLVEAKEKQITYYDSNNDVVRLLAEASSDNNNLSVVVGHSNTIPSLIQKLGGPKIRDIPEDEFDHFYILSRHDNQVSFLALRY